MKWKKRSVSTASTSVCWEPCLNTGQEAVTGLRRLVSIVTPPFDLHANPDEVAEVFEVPFPFFMDGTNYQMRTAEFPNGAGKRSFYTIPYENRIVWGATAGMLRNLYHFLSAK